MQYAILAGVFSLCVLGSWASFTDRVRNGSAYLPVAIAVSVGTGFLFAFGCRLLNDKTRIVQFSLTYDLLMALAYYLLPVLFFGVRPGWYMLAAAVCITAGILLLHSGD